MRIGTRLWISVCVTIIAVLGAGAGARLDDERELLRETTFADRRFFGDTIAVLLSGSPNSAATSPDLLRTTLATELEKRGAAVSVRTESLDGAASRIPVQNLAELRKGRVSTSARHDGSATTYVPFSYQGQRYALVLDESEGMHQVFLRTSMLHSVVSALALALVLGFVVWMLTRRLVSAPLARLGENARRLAAGQLSSRIEVRGNDELSDFARELNTMAEKLENAQKKLEEETSARVTLAEQLRHADRLRMVGLLSSSLAHELGTPLNVVIGHARLIERAPDIDEKHRERAHIIAEQVQRMTAILKRVLSFARREVPARNRIELGDVAKHAVQMLEPMAKKQGVTMHIEASEPVSVVANENQVLQALTNLMVNAIHAMPSGGALALRIGHDDRTDTSVGAAHGPFATLSVIDHGTGVNPDHLPHLFEPFFTTKSSGEGTGLGLTVASGIAQDHGGFIDVTSELGKGSTFTMRLPLAAR